MLNLCQFRVLTNAASSHVHLPLVTVAGHFANVQFANKLRRFANVYFGNHVETNKLSLSLFC